MGGCPADDGRAVDRACGAGRQLVRRCGGASRGPGRARPRVGARARLGSAAGAGAVPELEAAWEAEEAALRRGDVEAAVQEVVDAWTLPDASSQVRDRVAAMQRRAFARQAQAPPVTEAPDPLEQDPEALAEVRVPTLVAAGALDKRDFRHGAEAMARTSPRARHAVIEGAGHLAPLEAPEAFRELVLAFLR